MKEAEQLVAKAKRFLNSAQSLLGLGDNESCVSRAYYAMFYVAEALLSEKGLRFRKHGGVHGAFGEHFAKTSELDPKYHRWLLEAFNKRITADYGVEAVVTPEEAGQLIEQAREFLQEAERYLSRAESQGSK